MLPRIIVGRLLKLAAKKLLSEKLMKKVVISLGSLLVKSTKNKLDDKIWNKVKDLL